MAPSSRRAVLVTIAALPAVLAGCGGSTPRPPEESTAMGMPRAAETVIPEARALLAAAEEALSEAFAPLTWKDGDPERAVASGGGCAYATVTRRCDAFLGSERGTPQQIADALNPVLEGHGWPLLAAPSGGDGGWLSASSTRGTMTFEFRSKGRAEIAVRGTVDSETCTVTASDGGT